jgi:hypothetical protein
MSAAWRCGALWQHLPENHRTVLVLFDIEGYSYEEAAALLQLPMGTLKSRSTGRVSRCASVWKIAGNFLRRDPVQLFDSALPRVRFCLRFRPACP